MAGKRRRNTVAFRNTSGPRRAPRSPWDRAGDWLSTSTAAVPPPTIWDRVGGFTRGAAGAVPQRAAPPFPGYLTADQMLARARAAVMGAVGPQQDYYNQLIKQNQQQAEERAKFVAGLYQALGQFQRGVAPAVQQAYAQAGNDQAAIAQGYSGNMRDVAAQDAAAINADLAKAGTPQGGMVPGDQGAANVLYALGGAIPGRMLGAQGAAFGSAAAFLPSSTAGYGVRQAEYGLSQADQRRQEIQAELDKLVASEPSLIQEQLGNLQSHQDEAQRWWSQFNYNKKQDAQERADAIAADKAARAEAAARYKQARIDAGLEAESSARKAQSDAAIKIAKLQQQQDAIDERIRHNKAMERNQAATAKQRAAASAENRKLQQQRIKIQQERLRISKQNAATQSSYNTPDARRAKAVGARTKAYKAQSRRASSTARTYAAKGYTRNQAWQALYQDALTQIGNYTTDSGRAGWDKQIRRLVNQALYQAGWRTGKNTTSALYKSKGGGSDDPYAG